MEKRLENVTFEGLVSQIERTNDALRNNARLVINRHVTAKAWLTGYYVVVYEQKGSDRAKYGERLLQNLAKRLGNQYALSTLKLYRLFYLTYPQLGSAISDFLIHLPNGQSVISQLLLPSGKSQSVISQLDSKNTPIGILMCSEIGQEMAEYTLLDIDEDIFISNYELSLPSKERMTEFLRKENEELVK